MNYYNQNNPYYLNNQSNNERFGFIGPFILGGITGGLIAGNNNKNYNCCPQPVFYGYPMIQPCCRKY